MCALLRSAGPARPSSEIGAAAPADRIIRALWYPWCPTDICVLPIGCEVFDVTSQFNLKYTRFNQTAFEASNAEAGHDPCVGRRKTLSIMYRYFDNGHEEPDPMYGLRDEDSGKIVLEDR